MSVRSPIAKRFRSIKDIYKLPYTLKSDLRANYPFGMMAASRRDIIRLHASSATTGKLTVAGLTRKDIEVWADCAARSLVMAGADEESIVHVSYGYGLFTGGLGMHYGAERLGAVVVPASAGNTQKQIQLLVDFGADIICCTPSYIIYLTEEIEKERSKKEQIEAQKAEYLKADTLKSDHKSVKTDSSLKSETAKSEGRNRTRENEKDEGEDAGVKNKKSAE